MSTTKPPLPDHENPDFLFSITSTALLLAIESGSIDPILLARRELASRGVDRSGTWVGFTAAVRIHLEGQEAGR
ncbi:MAG: hypothetical protein Q7U75_08620 [Desulfobacterales bacterium]|nr:hypothetical protein [Desulfobacterales bacterium]